MDFLRKLLMNKSNQDQRKCNNQANDGLGVDSDFVTFDELIMSSSAFLVSNSKLQSNNTVGIWGVTGAVLATNTIEIEISGSSSLEFGWGRCCPGDNLFSFSEDSETKSGFEFLDASPAKLDCSEWVVNLDGLDRVNDFGSNKENPKKNGTRGEDQSAVDSIFSSSCGCERKDCKCSDNEHQSEINPARSRTVDEGFEHVQNTTPEHSELNQLLLAKKGN